MTAATADLDTETRDGRIGSYPMAAAEIFLGTLVTLNASGYATPGADTAAFVFAGIATEGIDNSDGSAGDLDIEVWTSGCYRLTGSGFAITDVGQPVFLIDDSTVGLSDNASVDQHIRVGTIAEYISATEAWVRIEPGQPAKAAGKALGEQRHLFVRVAAVNADDLDLSTAAAVYGASDIYVDAVLGAVGWVTADGTLADGLLVATTDYTLAGGVITTVGDKSAQTWDLQLLARLK